jgi:hypothetical protein
VVTIGRARCRCGADAILRCARAAPCRTGTVRRRGSFASSSVAVVS